MVRVSLEMRCTLAQSHLCQAPLHSSRTPHACAPVPHTLKSPADPQRLSHPLCGPGLTLFSVLNPLPSAISSLHPQGSHLDWSDGCTDPFSLRTSGFPILISVFTSGDPPSPMAPSKASFFLSTLKVCCSLDPFCILTG